MDASVHVSNNQWANVLVLDGSFKFVISTGAVTVEERVVLQITLTTLIANWTVKRVVDQKELHDAASGNSGCFRVGVNFHSRSHLGTAAGHGFGRLFDFDQTHSTVSGHFQSFVITESGNFNTILFGSLVN